MPRKDQLLLEAEVLSYHEIHELPGDWAPDRLRSLLADLEVETDGVPESDLLDLTMMAVADLDPHDAGVAVLTEVFGDRMPPGVRSNLASDLQEDRPWEDFADLSHQEGIFTTTVLLHQAHPKLYGTPDATQAEIALKANSVQDRKLTAGLTSAQLLRALAPGLGSRSIVARLYADGLRSGPFPEAESILWRYEMREDPADPMRTIMTVLGAHCFLAGLNEADSWPVVLSLES